MKRILFAFIIIICACSSVCAQNSSLNHRVMTECLKFRGVPMNQQTGDLMEVFIGKGYKYMDEANWDKRWKTIIRDDPYHDVMVLSGDYAGFDDCCIIINDSTEWRGPIGHSFKMIHVLLPETESINTLIHQYNNLSSKLSDKYPAVIDEAKIPKHIKDYSIGVKECISDYYPEYGRIELSILRLDDKHAIVVVSYLNTPKPKKDYFEEEI